MKRNLEDISFDDFDEIVSPRPDKQEFDRVIESIVSRRDFLKTTIFFGGITALGSMIVSGPGLAAVDRFPFDSIPANDLDTVTLPKGYESEVLVRWGDPVWSSGVAFDHGTRGTSESQATAFGDNNDGMDVFPYDDKLLLVVNH